MGRLIAWRFRKKLITRRSPWSVTHYTINGHTTLCGKEIPVAYDYGMDMNNLCKRCFNKRTSMNKKEQLWKPPHEHETYWKPPHKR